MFVTLSRKTAQRILMKLSTHKKGIVIAATNKSKTTKQ